MLQSADLAAVIIGSGFSGLAVAFELRRAGIEDFVILERAAALGGTWRDNTYPGCACDVPSNLYSLSFSPSFDWSRTFAPQAEIRDYLDGVATQFDLQRHIHYDCEVVAAEWSATANHWRVTTQSGRVFRARALVVGAGAFHTPSVPKLPGIESFRGPQFHSAQWDRSFSPQGKRVLVVGTGASAVQFVPKLQPDVRSLFLLQRTPAWVLPRGDRAFTSFERAALRVVPGLRRLYRGLHFWGHEGLMLGFKGHRFLMPLLVRQCERHMARGLSDRSLRSKLTPKYRVGCKRVLFSDDYYPALGRENVEVLDDLIERVGESHVSLRSGRTIEVDAIIFGTGFEVHKYIGGIDIRGEGNVDLGATWRSNGAQAFLGTMVAGFPNLFLMTGPNTGLGHNSMIVMIEAQAGYVRQAMLALKARSAASIQPKPTVQGAYNSWLAQQHSTAVWASGCKSWYLDSRGKNTALWPGFATTFRRRLARLRIEDHQIK